jgi:lipopolysaccharide/colanic/teichoic acid biosynthesis glycosyltransferase
MTGLWQVTGRSELSCMLDFSILWKTVNAVVRGRGAY